MSKSLEKIVAALAAWQQHALWCRHCNAFRPACRRGAELYLSWRRAAALPPG